MARHTKKKEKRNTERMSIITTCRAWKVLFQGKENKKSLINWKGKRKKKEVKKRTQQGYPILIKLMIINCTKSVKLTSCLLWNKFFQNKCVSHHKMHTPEEDSFVCHMSCQYTGISCNVAVHDGHSILNYVVLVSTNLYMQVQMTVFH